MLLFSFLSPEFIEPPLFGLHTSLLIFYLSMYRYIRKVQEAASAAAIIGNPQATDQSYFNLFYYFAYYCAALRRDDAIDNAIKVISFVATK